jgi:hypothetical protein
MSRIGVRKKPRKPSKATRERIGAIVAEKFASLTPDQRNQFVFKMLYALTKMSRRQMQKYAGRFSKQGRPSAEMLAEVFQFICVFTYSIKPEFQYLYAMMLNKAFKQPNPPDLEDKMRNAQKFKWIHFPMLPNVYDRLYREFEKNAVSLDKTDSFGDFVTKLMNRAGVPE